MAFRTGNKYGNKWTEIDGEKFQSQGEGKRWLDLKTLEKGGVITRLTRQVRIPLIVDGFKICTYTADFVYFEGNKEVYEDFKGFRTVEYKIKKKLMWALHGIDIFETGKGSVNKPPSLATWENVKR